MNPWACHAYRLTVVVGLVLVVGGRDPGGDRALGAAASPGVLRESPRVLRTAPSCDEIIGYTGPNDCEIHLDVEGRIETVRLLRSGDTPEHAAAVRDDPGFFGRFSGIAATDRSRLAAIDGVSRATLTSLAIVEAVTKRLSGSRPSLRFPLPIELVEVQRLLPAARQLSRPGGPGFAASVRILGSDGQVLGLALRTGPAMEAVLGYQGPTDTLLVFGGDHQLLGLAIRRSYDNEPYVRYVREDRYFAEQFVGRSLVDLAAMAKGFDSQGSVDGVSGATMTSLAVAEAVVSSAARLQRAATVADPAAAEPTPPSVLRRRDVGTLVALALALLLTFTRLRGHRRLRVVARVATVVYLGVLSGDMLSQGLLLGWVGHGMPWHLAPGLVALAAVALFVPMATGRQIYCHQLCAHGALQELLRRLPWRRPLPGSLARLRGWLPGGLLVLSVLGWLWLGSGFAHASIEPFGAWAWPLAGIATCFVAGLSLVFSALYPMAYCRIGCPTGYLLDYLRRRGSASLRGRDVVGGLLLLLAVALRLGAGA